MALTYRERTLESRTRQKWVLLAGLVALCYSVALVAGLGVDQGRSWFEALPKPSWTPPGWAVAAVWVVLYGFMAVAAWLVWYEREHLIEEKRLAMAAFGVQLVLNALWPWLFFALRSPVLALGELIVLHFAVQYTGFLFSRIRAAAGWLWLGYVGWTVFAILLNYAVVAMAR